MRIPRLYCPRLQVGANTLGEEEAHHATHVLRLAAGDEVVLFDGAGGEAKGRIESATRGGTVVVADSLILRPFDLRFRLTLAVAMSKAHRQSYLIEKCTELGAAGFWPIATERGVTKPAEAAVEKWSRRAIEAAKQSGRAWVPSIQALQPLDRAIARRGEFAAAFVTIPEAAIPIDSAIAKQAPDAGMLIFVGPEGGWSSLEMAVFESNAITAVALSPTVLRTETATVAACAAVALLSCPRSIAP